MASIPRQHGDLRKVISLSLSTITWKNEAIFYLPDS